MSEHPAEVIKPGAVTLSAKYVFDIVQNLPEAQLTVKKLPNNYVEITSRHRPLQDRGHGPRGVPQAPEGRERAAGEGERHHAAGDDQEDVRSPSPRDETRYILNGVFFEPREGGKVRMVATDGHRLALIERELDGRLQAQGRRHHSAQGPVRAASGCSTRRPDAECQLGFAENSALFKKPGLIMVMRLIDGQFPEYQRVIPKEGEKQVHGAARSASSKALKRIALLSADKSNAVKLGAVREPAAHHRQQPGPGRGEGRHRGGLPRRRRSPSASTRATSSTCSASLESDEVVLELGDEHSPGVLHAPGDRSYTAVVMPMRV